MYANITERLRAREVRKSAPGYIKGQDLNPFCWRKPLC